jgi:threonine dehydrogenase-like Zn-dependent dehydrogenase
MGADIVVDPATESPHAHWRAHGVPASMLEAQLARMTGQAVARPIVFECVGAPNVLQSLIEGAPPGAQIVVAGVCMESDRIEPSLAINKELELTFVLGYSPEEFARTLHDIAEGRIDAEAIVTSRVSLAETPNAFARLAAPDAEVKIVVEPWR